MKPDDPWNRIGRLLPEEQRESFFAMASRLRAMPEDDELLLLVEAIGFMTLLWREVPAQIESIMAHAKPAGHDAGDETTGYLLNQIKASLREILDQPTHADLRGLMEELKDGQRQFHGSVQRLEQCGHRSKCPRRSPQAFIVLTVAALATVAATSAWLHRNYQHPLERIESTVPGAEDVARLLGRRPAAGITAFEGVDEGLDQAVRAIVIEGPVIDAFTDPVGRGVVRIQAAE